MEAVFDSSYRDVLHRVLLFLNHRDVVLSFSPLSKQLLLRNNQGEGASIDYNYVFLSLCRRRFNIDNQSKFLRSVGASRGNWCNAFQIASRRRKIPYGIYTACPYGDNVVFARGRAGGVDLWLLVNHTPDTLLRSEGPAALGRYIDLRLVVQNFGNERVAVDACGARSYSRSLGGRHACSAPLRPIAVNGQKCSPEGDQDGAFSIPRYGFHVYSCLMPCSQPPLSSSASSSSWLYDESDEAILNELDFLTVTHRVSVHIIAGGARWELSAQLGDEGDVADSYLQLPGGVVLLRDRNDRKLSD